MRKKSTIQLLLCLAVPLIMVAQSNQKPPVIYHIKNNGLPGVVIPTWDSASKNYTWQPFQNKAAGNVVNAVQTNVVNDATGASSVFHIVKDINKITDGGGFNYQPQFHDQHYAVLNGVAYFIADDGIHGSELWRSDGTMAGSYILMDVEPGKASSDITNIVAANGKIYFTATTSVYGAEPWISDGTTAGTHMLANINLYANGAYPEMYTAVGNKVFFFAGRSQLWVTDGTVEGTKIIPMDYSTFDLATPVALGDKFIFTANSYYYGRALWSSDGSDNTPVIVAQFNYDYYGPQQLTVYKNKLYFSAPYNYNRTLWVSDGTDRGTSPLDINGAVTLLTYDNPYPNIPLGVFNNSIYFSAYGNSDNLGYELYKYKISDSFISLVKDITPGYPGTSIDPYEWVSNGNELLFKVLDNSGSFTLWKTKGTASNTVPVKTFFNSNSNSGNNIFSLFNYKGTILFQAYTLENGYELWKSDGTESGTVMVKDIYSGSGGSYPYYFSEMPDGVLFSAKNAEWGRELWKTDGTSEGTQLAKDINQVTTGSAMIDNNIASTTNGVVFTAFDEQRGIEPYYSEGTQQTTKIVKDIFKGSAGSSCHAITSKGENAYFIANNSADISSLYQYNTTTKELNTVFNPVQGSTVMNYTAADNGLMFVVVFNSWLYQYEIWRTDGTTAGTYKLKYGFNPTEIVTVGNTAFFSSDDDNYGNELFKSDGTVEGTKIVRDIYPGYNGSYIYSLFVYNGEVYFGATDENYTQSLWKSNGKWEGTKRLAPIQPHKVQSGDRNMSSAYCISNGWLYINANYGSEGEELWKTNGTAKNTLLVKDINPYNSSSINYMTDINGVLYFIADDATHGSELWKSNGKQQGTSMVKDITVSGGSAIMDLCTAGGKLYFVKDNALWQSDGSADNTVPVADEGLNDVFNINELIASGNKLFFSGYTTRRGQELYSGDVSLQAAAVNKASNVIAEKLTANFKASIFPNPVQSVATLQLSNAKNASIILTDNSGKIIWQQNNVSNAQLQIPMQKFAAGIYFVKITNNNATTTLKLVKEN